MIKVIRNAPEGDLFFIKRDGELLCIIMEEERKKLIEDLKNIGKRKKASVPFLGRNEEVKKLFTSNQRHIRLIARYIVEKNMQFYSSAELATIVSRNAKASSILASYPDEKILDTIAWLKKQTIKGEPMNWTLETVSRYAAEIDTLLKKEAPKKALGEFIIT